MKWGVGRNSGGSSSTPSSPASAPLSSSRSRSSRSSHSETSLPALSSAGTSLPTSVVERKSSTSPLHLPSVRRSRTFHRLFHFSDSFSTSSRRTLCWGLHSGHSLNKCSRVCVGVYRHRQHCRVGCLFVQWRYCQVRQCPVFTWYGWGRLKPNGPGHSWRGY